VPVVRLRGFRPPFAVFEHDRTDTDDGLDFDFFDDSPTVEESRERESRPRTRPRLPRRPPGGPGSPLLRRAALIVGAILLVVVLVLWVNACRADAKKAHYEDYMEGVAGVTADSAAIGRELNELLFTSGVQLEDLQTQLEALRERQSQTVSRAEGLDAPGPLREQQESLVESLQLRVSGLNGLARAFSQVTGTEDNEAQQAGELLATQSERLVASDVVYEDLFKARSQEVMEQQGVTGVAVPDSDFVSNGELASPTSWTQIIQRITRPPDEAGGLRGNKIASVVIQPGDQQLTPSEENTCKVSDDLAFDVNVENSGDSQETQVKVTLTIQQAPENISKEETIQVINPGETKTVTFSDIGAVEFASRTAVKVAVAPVQGESNKSNNSAEYICFFTIS
jgi:CARDB protein